MNNYRFYALNVQLVYKNVLILIFNLDFMCYNHNIKVYKKSLISHSIYNYFR